ncbi:MAG: hypothetical protein ACIALR_16450, partial [Blastopirellula sp. JB062]
NRIEILNPAQLPRQWLNYTSFDLVFITLADLQALKTTQPQAFAAFTQWVRCGGNLIVTDLGAASRSFQADCAALTQLLEMPQEQAGDRWQPRPPKSARAGLDQLHRLSNSGTPYNETYVTADGTLREGQIPTGSSPPPTLNMRNWQFGLLVAVDGSPFPGDSSQWKDMFARIGGDRWMRFERNGMSQLRENDSYWNFMIPGVGQSPVTLFLVLISLFVVLIGPVNYVLLRMAGRLNWIIVTVPAGASLVTLTMIGFALFSDGFGVKLRTRTVTIIDQRSGVASVWSRQSYYAGLAPSAGLTFPRDAATFEILPSPLDNDRKRLLVLSDEAQHLKQGYFLSRVTQQMLVMRPLQTDLKLAITPQGDSLQVENQLGVDVRMVAITGPEGKKVYLARHLRAGESRTLNPSAPVEVGEIRTLLSEYDLQLPPGFNQSAYLAGNRYRYNNRFRYHQLPEAGINVTHASSRLEREITESLQSGFPGAPYTYEALVERSSLTPVGVPQYRSEASVELIRGRW